MSSYKPGDVVIMEHPFMLHRHVVAEIVATTKKTCTVYYWSSRGRSDEPKRRNLSGIVGKAETRASPGELNAALALLSDLRHDIVKEADAQYLRNVRSYVKETTR